MVGSCNDGIILCDRNYQESLNAMSKGNEQISAPASSSTTAASSQKSPGRSFNDPIHGLTELPALCWRVIDTIEFQRLRNIKQLGGSYFLFPGACHNRFEHSLGVCYLAGELVTALQRRQPELSITDTDVLCIQLAGLCHDLGHGPFSHLFDGKFIPRVAPGSNWKHEIASCLMFDHLIKQNKLQPEFEKEHLMKEEQDFIKSLILPPEEWKAHEKAFLFEIVANSRNGVDVDKWDYFARDCHYLGIGNSFDLQRLMKSAWVLSVEGEKQICYRDKEVANLYDMFHTRLSLHQRAYQHHITKVIEHMITDALESANEHIHVLDDGGITEAPELANNNDKREDKGITEAPELANNNDKRDDKGITEAPELANNNDKRDDKGKAHKMSECVSNMSAYTKLTDQIFYVILHSKKGKLDKSREILQRLLRRDLYRHIWSTPPKSQLPVKEICVGLYTGALFQNDIRKFLINNNYMKEEDIIVELVTLDYGCQSSNPIDNIYFYEKSHLGQPQEAHKIPKERVSQTLPDVFTDKTFHIISRSGDRRAAKLARDALKAWYTGQQT